MSIRKLIGFLPAMLAGALAFCSLAGPAQAGAPQTTATQPTDSYKIELDIGPAAVMLTPDQAATATSGEVMVDTSSTASGMSMGSGGMSMGVTAIPVPAMAAGALTAS